MYHPLEVFLLSSVRIMCRDCRQLFSGWSVDYLVMEIVMVYNRICFPIKNDFGLMLNEVTVF